MIELKNDGLVVTFPDVHPDAGMRVIFQRTLRIPDDGRTYPLPPGLGAFPLRHVDDFSDGVPPAWRTQGGVLLPMYQAEALWVSFEPLRPNAPRYPCAVKIAAGKINAVTGKPWTNDLAARPQDYVVTPDQPWLDGFAVRRGVIRQFVAMPLGDGYTAEEQLTGAADHGGLQILVRPMKRECYERRLSGQSFEAADATGGVMFEMCSTAPEMGLAPGGSMRQEIYDDPYGVHEWDRSVQSRCFVHLLNSMMWEAVTGSKPPLPPPTAATYAAHGLPWFEYYGENLRALDGAAALARLRSVIEIARQKGERALPENDAFTGERVVRLGWRRTTEVREGRF
jgi:hypothetical protein